MNTVIVTKKVTKMTMAQSLSSYQAINHESVSRFYILKEINDRNFQLWKKQKRRERKLRSQEHICRVHSGLIKTVALDQTEEKNPALEVSEDPSVYRWNNGLKHAINVAKKINRMIPSTKQSKNYSPIWKEDAYKQHLRPLSKNYKRSEHKESIYNLQGMLTNLFLTSTLDPNSSISELFNFDACAHLKDLTIDKVLEFLKELKPMTLSLCLSNYVAAKSQQEKIAVLACLWETCELYWSPRVNIWKIFIITALTKIFDYIISTCWSSVRDTLGSDEEVYECQSFSLKEDGFLKKVFDFCNIDSEKIKLTEEHSFLITCILVVVAIVTGGSFTGVCETSISKILKRMNKFSSGLKSINNITEFLPKVWDSTLSCVGSLLGFEHFGKDEEVEAFIEKVLKLKQEAHDIQTIIKFRPWEIIQNPNLIADMSKKYDELHEAYRTMMKLDKNMAASKGVFDELKETVKFITEYCQNLKHTACQKQEPWILILSGRPGIGKSRLIEYIVDKLGQQLSVPPTSYSRNTSTKHWDGYTGQSFIIYDDFGQIKTDVDHADIMAYKNPNKSQLPMADLPSKGTQFSSIGFICCTNIDKVESSAAIKCTEALNRRFEVDIFVHDPCLDDFIAEHNCPPAMYYQRKGEHPTVQDVDGNMVPYFSEDFSHLQFFLKPSYINPDDPPIEISLAEVLNIVGRFHMEFREKFEASLANANKHLNFKLPGDVPIDNVLRMSDLQRKDVVLEDPEPQPEEPEEPQPGTSVSSTESTKRKRDTAISVIKEITKREGEELYKEAKKSEIRDSVKKGVIKVDEYAEAMSNPIEWVASLQKEIATNHKEHGEEKRKFIADYCRRTGHTRSRAETAWMERSFKRGYQLHGAASESAESFQEIDLERGEIYCIYGKPGTGKSTFQEALFALADGKADFVHGQDLLRFVPEKAIVFIEDPTANEASFRIFEDLVCKVYDGKSVIKKIITSINLEILLSYFKGQQERFDRFKRRCAWIEFAFQIKKKNIFSKHEYYTAADVEKGVAPYVTMVSIKCNAISEGYISDTVLRTFFLKKFETLRNKVKKIPIATQVPYLNQRDYTPDFQIVLNSSIEESFHEYYDNPAKMVTDIALGKIKLTKGKAMDGVKIAQQFTGMSGVKIEWPGSLDAFIILANNSQMVCTVPFKTEIVGTDGRILIVPQNAPPNTVLIFKVVEHFQITDAGNFQDGTEICTPNHTVEEIYKDVTSVQTHCEKLEKATNKTIERIKQSINIFKIFEQFPSFEKITAILIYIFKLFTAGMVIGTLFSAAKERFLDQQLIPEDKGKNKHGRGAMRNLSKRRNIRGSFHLYDEIRDVLDREFGKSARKMRVTTVVDYYLDYYGDDAAMDITAEEIEHFIKNVLTLEGDQLKLETREEKVEIQKPIKMTLTDPLEIEAEKKKIIVTPAPEKSSFSEENLVPMNLEALYDPEIRETFNITHKNMIEIYSGEKRNFRCFGLMVHGKIGATVNHIFDPTEKYYAKCFLGTMPTESPMELVKQYPHLDIAIFKLTAKSAPSYRDIRHMLPERNNDLKKATTNKTAILMVPERGHVQRNVFSAKISGTKQIKTNLGEFDGLAYNSSICYLGSAKITTPINTKPGDCGSPIIVNDPTVLTKIVGLHHAANEFDGHASFLYKELFPTSLICEAMEDVKSKRFVNPHHDLEIREYAEEALLGMPIAGEGSLVFHRPTKSRLWTSPLAIPESEEYQPSIIDAYDCRNNSSQDPFYRSVAKWNNPQPKMDEDLLNKAVDDVAYWYAMQIKTKQIETKVLTKTEAINSGANYNVMPLNRKSAAGYPWAKYGPKESFLVNKGTGNEAYFGIDLTKKCGRELNASIDFIIHTCRTPKQHVAVPFSGWLKDEPLKKKKIFDVNTRSFAGAPLDYTIAYRMYFSTIYGAIHSVRSTMPVQVGINPTSLEWHWMMMRLLSCSDVGFDLDFQGFDSTVPSIVQKKIVRIHNYIARINDPNWKEEDDIVRENLHQSLVKPIIVVPLEGKSYMLQAPGGQISGHPGTADDNSLIHLVYLYYAWLVIMMAAGRLDLCNISSFRSFVQAIIYGDDGGYAVAIEVSELFNFVSVAAVLHELGIKCTPASKGDVIQKIIPVKEFEFLKRDFVKKGAYWFGALKKNSFGKMLGYCLGPSHNWYNDQKVVYCGRPGDLIATADSALREATFHGKKFFEEMAAHLHSKMLKMDIDWFPPQFSEMIQILELPIPYE